MTLPKAAVKHLLSIYEGEHICIFLRDMHVITMNEEGNEMKISMIVEGVCLMIDESAYYLGLPTGEITKTVPHASVGLVEVQFGSEMLDLDLPMDGEIH